MLKTWLKIFEKQTRKCTSLLKGGTFLRKITNSTHQYQISITIHVEWCVLIEKSEKRIALVPYMIGFIELFINKFNSSST